MVWAKGQSGNPDGTKVVKGKPWAGAIRRAIAESDREALLEIAKALVAKAAEGDLQAIKELGDRLDGKPSQQIHSEISGPDGGPMQVEAVERVIVKPRE